MLVDEDRGNDRTRMQFDEDRDKDRDDDLTTRVVSTSLQENGMREECRKCGKTGINI